MGCYLDQPILWKMVRFLCKCFFSLKLLWSIVFLCSFSQESIEFFENQKFKSFPCHNLAQYVIIQDHLSTNKLQWFLPSKVTFVTFHSFFWLYYTPYTCCFFRYRPGKLKLWWILFQEIIITHHIFTDIKDKPMYCIEIPDRLTTIFMANFQFEIYIYANHWFSFKHLCILWCEQDPLF